jgi:hypothetical protein
MVILGMCLEMTRQVIDARGKQRDLNFGGAGVTLGTLVIGDDLGFVGSGNCHCGFLADPVMLGSWRTADYSVLDTI